MRLCNTGEIFQDVLDGEFHGNTNSSVTFLNQTFKVLVLTDELILHCVPDHLGRKRKHDTCLELGMHYGGKMTKKETIEQQMQGHVTNGMNLAYTDGPFLSSNV